MKKDGEDYKFLILPDHPTPLALRTHTMDAVPYIMYDSTKEVESDAASYDEKFGKECTCGMKLKNYDKGYTMIDDFFSPARSFMRLPAFDFFGEGLHSIMAPAFPRLHLVLNGGECAAAPAKEAAEEKIPEDMGENIRLEREKAALKAQLSDAVKAEDYEKAIELRDSLRKLENKG